MEYEKFLEVIEGLRQKRVILIGTQAVMQMCYEVLQQFGCMNIAVCDNSVKRQGEMFLQHKITSLQEAISETEMNAAILCFLSKENEQAVSGQMEQSGVQEVYSKYLFVYGYYKYIQKRTIDFEKFARSVAIYENHMVEDDAIVFDDLNLMVTERCTLRCKDCGSLIPQIPHPVTFDKKQTIEALQRVAKNVDAVRVLNILGGEPFLVKDLIEFCKEASQIDNIHFIRIVTNGTIVPSQEFLDEVKRYVSYVRISDYGVHSRKKEELINVLQNAAIPYETVDIGEVWFAVGRIGTVRRTEQEAFAKYKSCQFVNQCMSLARGNLFPCGLAAMAQSLPMGYVAGKDYIDFSEIDITRDYRTEIKKLRNKTEAATLCGLCTMEFNQQVQGGVQEYDGR